MAVSALRRWAAAGAAPVYPVVGRHALNAVEDLVLHCRISLEATPRHASLLLVVGEIREEDRPDLLRLHDQLPRPRATLWWRADPDKAFERPIVVDPDADPIETLDQTYAQLLAGERASESDLLPDEPPAPWRGRGDHGQGGEGMMGGKPYGRPMPMTADDLRDGLALDAYEVTLGPFLPMLPPGLVLDVAFQGDVIQTARVRRAPFAQERADADADRLRCIARLLRVLGLAAQADRILRTANERPRGDVPHLVRLRRAFRWSGVFDAIPPGLGRVESKDVRDRFLSWWEAPEAMAEGNASAPDCTGVPPRADLADLLPGLEWSEAVLLINSFDIESLRRMCVDADTSEETAAGEGH